MADQPTTMDAIRTPDLRRPGTTFEHGGYIYRTSGAAIGHGGMGNAFEVSRRPAAAGIDEIDTPAVGKVFHAEYLFQLRTDEVTKRDHDCVLRNIDDIAMLEHPNLLPIYVSAPIADNHLFVTPRQPATLLQAVAAGGISLRRRVDLLIQALRGLALLHEQGFIHRDVTLRNILVDGTHQRAYLFDFDLALSQSQVAGDTYRTRYQGRIFGSPGFSVAPEILDNELMDRSIGSALDMYAVGSALFSLFTDELPYGPTEDMWSLLLTITEGVVFGSTSRIVYPDSVPQVVRPIIEQCMQHDPDDRPGIADIIGQLERALPQLSDGSEETGQWVPKYEPVTQVSAVYASRRDLSISLEHVHEVDQALARHGYQLQRSMGRVMEHPIFMAAPDPELVAHGQFPDSNYYPKIVTAMDLSRVDDAERRVELWRGTYLPILRAARQGLLTSLYRVVYDEPSSTLLLFSEYIDDARFGTALAEHDLRLDESLGLAYLVARQVRRLHARGIAHNNVRAASLLLKGLRATRQVHPAMVGIVVPSLDPADMAGDVRALSRLVLDWLGPARFTEADSPQRSRLADVHTRLIEIAAGTAERSSIDDFLDAIADGLSAIDFNFGVLRTSGGDLDAYALLLVSHSLYGRLWES